MPLNFKIILLVLVLACSKLAYATHNRAGEITYTWISGYTYQVTLTTYTRASSPADRCQLTIYFGDGDSCVANRNNGTSDPYGSCYPYGATQGVLIAPDIRLNTYSCEHTYPGPGNYWLYMQDPNRNEDIDNIPNSVNIVFYVHSLLVINPFLGSAHNNSVVLLNPPIDNGCINKCYFSNPGAYDVDGDSLSFKLVSCLGENGTSIAGYTLPPSSGNPISIDSYTGEVKWCSPPTPPTNQNTNQYPVNVVSEYNIAIWIEEWRNGFLIGGVERDMEINLYNCQDDPPIISTISDTCIVAGQNISFIVSARDPDNQYDIELTAGGGPLSPFVASPAAKFNPADNYVFASSQFSWQTQCSDIRQQPYNVIFKAQNQYRNAYPPASYYPLSSYTSVNIKVVPPTPYQLTAEPIGTSIHLSWRDSACSSRSGFEVYRLNECQAFVPAACTVGVPAGVSGYSYLGFTTDTSFTDNNNGIGLARGTNYSYIVVALFHDGSESFASAQVCARLKADAPIITGVSVIKTDTSRGQIAVGWLNPIAGALGLDTVQNPPPYEYRVMRSQSGSSNFVQIASFTSTSFYSLKMSNDTSITDSLLNTSFKGYTYRVDFYSNQKQIGSTNTASSVFAAVNAAVGGQKLLLSWNSQVPWINYQFVVYRFDTIAKIFKAIATTSNTFFADSNLTNSVKYTYKVESIGAYSDSSIFHPTINFSEIVSGIPTDKQPPCPPVLRVNSNCNDFTDSLQFNNPNFDGYPCGKDVGSKLNPNALTYNIYFAPTTGAPLTLLKSIFNPNDTVLSFDSLKSVAGCYAVTAIDSFKNESAFSNIVCVDNCPNYQLPNVFSPNSDGHNDYFVPFPYKYIQKIDLQIFNRWGELVFQSNDPAIHWNGTNQQTKRPCSDGVYFYTCTVYEIHVDGIHTQFLKGSIELVNSEGDPGTH